MHPMPKSNVRIWVVSLVLTASAVGCASSQQAVQCPDKAVSPAGGPGAENGETTAPPLDYTKTLDGVTDIDGAVVDGAAWLERVYRVVVSFAGVGAGDGGPFGWLIHTASFI